MAAPGVDTAPADGDEAKLRYRAIGIRAFEHAVAREARQRGFDGVVCGHIHRVEVREIDGTLHCNDGDWVESLCALVEQEDGRLAIVHWHELAGFLTLGEGGRAQRAVEADVAVARG